MKPQAGAVRDSPSLSLENLLAKLLSRGTWLASGVIALGLAVGSFRHDLRIAAAGIALFIALPVARVATMLVVFLRRRDYRFSALAALVLTIIALGIALGAGG
jgi:uncharacterized membrane protein